jgi:hypothetical protein
MDEKDCRLCKYFNFDRSVEVEFFTCHAGFYDFIDYGDRIEGKQGPNCNGENFVLDTNSRWYEGSPAYKENRRRLGLEKEVGEDEK